MLYTDDEYLKTYKVYVGLKLHFDATNSFVYNGYTKMNNLSLKSFLKRSDFMYFVKLTDSHKKYISNYILSMYLIDSNMWVGEMNKRVNFDKHRQRISTLSNINYILDSELNQMLMLNGTFDSCLSVSNIPKIYKECSLETCAIVNSIRNFTDKESINPLWNAKRKLINNYSMLIKPTHDMIDIVNKYM